MARPPSHLRLAPAPEVSTELVEAPTSGAVPDLEQAFHAYGRYVAWIGTRILGRPEDVDDLVQDVFVDAARGLHKLRDPEATKAWLATLAVRKARGMLRKRRVKRFLGFDEGSDYATVVDTACPPEGRVAVAELYRMLDDLPVDQRLAWTLRHLENEPLERVATLCGCSLATAKRRIAAAHAVLVEEFGYD